MKTYSGYLIASYTIVFGCLALLFWMSIKRSVAIKKQLLKSWQDTAV